MSFNSHHSISPGYSEGELNDLDEDLDVVKKEGDQVLHLNYRGLVEMPQRLIAEAPDFQKITRIYMKRNKLASLPDDIGRLPNLVELYLPANELISLPESISGLQSLESLDVSYNRLQEIPSSLGALTSLERLHLASNHLTLLPKEIGKLKNLRVLDVINNDLRHLPLEIVKCSNLLRLLVDRNNLHWLPTEIVTMETLEELSATGNNILCLPMDLGDMPSLKYVYVDNNLFLHAVPVSIENQELGFSNSGIQNFVRAYNQRYRSITISHSTSESKVIYLPREIRQVGDLETDPVPSLLELSMRATHKTYESRNLDVSELPQSLGSLLRSPVCRCHICRCTIFTTAFPLVFEGQVRIYSLYRLALCCSERCVRIAMIVVRLPLIYPSASILHVALALVD